MNTKIRIHSIEYLNNKLHLSSKGLLHLNGIPDKRIQSAIKNCICNDDVHSDVIFISGDFLLNKAFKECRDTQLTLFNFNKLTEKIHNDQVKLINPPAGFNFEHSLCINHFTLFVDTIFRMLVIIKRYIKHLKTKFKSKRIIIENDIIHIPESIDVYDPYSHRFVSSELAERRMINKLYKLSMLLDDDMLSDFDIWERYLSKKYAKDYNFSMHYPRYRVSEKYRYKIYNNSFDTFNHLNEMPNKKYYNYAKKELFNLMRYMYYSQCHLKSNEIEIIFKYIISVLNQIKCVEVYDIISNEESYKNKCYKEILKVKGMTLFSFKFLDETDDLFKHIYNEGSLKSNRIVAVCDMYVKTKKLFIYDFKDLYYTGALDANDYNYRLDLPLVKHKYKIKKITDFFDDCNKEYNDRMIDVFDYMTIEVFKDLKATYVDNKINVLKPKRFEVDEYSWIIKDLYESMLPSIITRFNRMFGFKLE